MEELASQGDNNVSVFRSRTSKLSKKLSTKIAEPIESVRNSFEKQLTSQ
jgi:hypothetical protein